MNGYFALTTKELRESLATHRLLIAAAVFLFAGISGPVLTHMLPDLVRNSSSANIRIIVGKQTADDAVNSYLGNVTQLPILAAILLAMGAVAEERTHGAGALILCRPVSRVAYLLAKLTAHGAVLLGSLALGAAGAFYYIALLFDGARALPFLYINLGVAMSLLDVLAITLLCSSVLRSGMAAGGAALGLYLALSLLPKLWLPLDASLPGAITGHARDLLAGTWGGRDLLRPLAGGLGLAIACMAYACLTLRRQDV